MPGCCAAVWPPVRANPLPKPGSASSDTSAQSPEGLILEALAPYAQGLEEGSKTSISYLLQEDEDRCFGAGRYSSGERYSLVIGLVSPDGTVLGSPFETGAYGGRPYLQTFSKDGQKYLLYTATGMQTGLSWGEAGLIRLEEDGFTWVWPVEGDIRDKQSAAYGEYQDYWTDHLPLMGPGAWRSLPTAALRFFREKVPSGSPITTSSSSPPTTMRCPFLFPIRCGSGWKTTPPSPRATPGPWSWPPPPGRSPP